MSNLSNPWRIKNARDRAYELLEEGRLTPEYLAQMCLQYMSTADIEDMLLSNDIIDEEETEQDWPVQQESLISILLWMKQN